MIRHGNNEKSDNPGRKKQKPAPCTNTTRIGGEYLKLVRSDRMIFNICRAIAHTFASESSIYYVSLPGGFKAIWRKWYWFLWLWALNDMWGSHLNPMTTLGWPLDLCADPVYIPNKARFDGSRKRDTRLYHASLRSAHICSTWVTFCHHWWMRWSDNRTNAMGLPRTPACRKQRLCRHF